MATLMRIFWIGLKTLAGGIAFLLGMFLENGNVTGFVISLVFIILLAWWAMEDE